MCCGNEQMSEHHGSHGFHDAHHKGMMYSCCCGGRRFVSRKERIEMLEEYKKSLKNELEGVEEELNDLRRAS